MCIVYVKYVQFIVCQLHLNKAVNIFVGLESCNSTYSRVRI